MSSPSFGGYVQLPEIRAPYESTRCDTDGE